METNGNGHDVRTQVWGNKIFHSFTYTNEVLGFCFRDVVVILDAVVMLISRASQTMNISQQTCSGTQTNHVIGMS